MKSVKDNPKMQQVMSSIKEKTSQNVKSDDIASTNASHAVAVKNAEVMKNTLEKDAKMTPTQKVETYLQDVTNKRI